MDYDFEMRELVDRQFVMDLENIYREITAKEKQLNKFIKEEMPIEKLEEKQESAEKMYEFKIQKAEARIQALKFGYENEMKKIEARIQAMKFSHEDEMKKVEEKIEVRSKNVQTFDEAKLKDEISRLKKEFNIGVTIYDQKMPAPFHRHV